MLTTKYSHDMDINCPHSYYPRPQFKRESFLCLNGSWELGYTDTLELTEDISYDRRITVPFPHESLLSGIGSAVPEGKILAYRREVEIPEGFIRARTFLHFGAVDQICRVYVNGALKGENEGGYLPFSVDITEEARLGKFSVAVLVKDELDTDYTYGKQTKKRGGMWYTTISGIWQTVWIESLPEKYIEGIKIEPHSEGVRLTVRGGERDKLLCLESGEKFSFSGDTADIRPGTLRPWSPEDPYLYSFTLESGEDIIESYFAIRTLDIRPHGEYNRIFLNGKPIIMNGLLDQGYYPDGLFLPATEEGYLDDIKLAKSLGYNMLRKHIKIEPMIFYHLCDREGILVLQDMVNNGRYSFLRDTALPTVGMQRIGDSLLNRGKKAREIFIDQMKRTAEHLFNTPSVVYYTVFNEGWGQFRADDAYRIIKEVDPTRIIDSTSGWFRQRLSDVDSRHVYFKKLKAKSRSGAPLVISEFGGYSHRVEGHLFGSKNYGYRTYTDRDEFCKALTELYENEVIPMKDLGASVFVYTQLSDVEDETNGILTYDRKVIKIKPEEFKDIAEKVKI